MCGGSLWSVWGLSMQICLVNAPISAEFSDAAELQTEEVRRISSDPQLGILTLAAVLEANQCAPRIVDLNRSFFRYADNVGESRIDEYAGEAAREIASVDAAVYGFGSICSAYPLTLRIAKLVKAARPESAIVLGGPQASVVAEQTLAAFSFVDFVLRGESEQSLPIFLEELTGRRKFDRVPGLTHRSVWGVQRNPDAPLIGDLDALPAPAYHLTGELRGLHRASLELGRGCPFSCAFCSTNDFFRRKFRLRSPERVLEDMRAIEAEYGIRDFDLVHDMFTVDAKRVRAFCQTMIDSGEGYTWSCSARTDCVDEGLIELMAAAGCKGMFFGIETGSERMQKVIDKHLDTRRAHEIIDIAERAGVRSTVSLITGFPQETWDDLRQTVQMFMHSARTPQSKPQLNLLAPLANTPLHTAYKQEMSLDLLCSEMSHQGRKQNPEDMDLIRRYPDIFPNFYLLPTPHLDRALLMELREFSRLAEARFRWLLGAVDQVTGGVLDFFLEWIPERERLYPAMAGSDLRHYYRTPQFASDFTAFLRNHPAGDHSLVKVFLDFEDALSLALSPDRSLVANSVRLRAGQALEWSDIPIRIRRSRVVELPSALESAIEAVKAWREHQCERGTHYYVVAQNSEQDNAVFEVSVRVAKTVNACNGLRTMAQVVQHLSSEFPEIREDLRSHVFVSLVERCRAEGLVAIYRPSRLKMSAVIEANESQAAVEAL